MSNLNRQNRPNLTASKERDKSCNPDLQCLHLLTSLRSQVALILRGYVLWLISRFSRFLCMSKTVAYHDTIVSFDALSKDLYLLDKRTQAYSCLKYRKGCIKNLPAYDLLMHSLLTFVRIRP